MREIKFRGYVIEELVGTQWVTDGFGVGKTEYTDGTNSVYLSTQYGEYIVDEKSVGQYTGLKDKNDKEIYEGDILKFTWDEDSCWGEPGTYKGYIQFSAGVFEIVYIGIDKIRKYPDGGWSENSASGDIKSFLWWTEKENIEVIGNIYENPELLKKLK